eukprot:SAG22_NODE_3301_length_1794_cov_2.880236_2_plen_188_part_00
MLATPMSTATPRRGGRGARTPAGHRTTSTDLHTRQPAPTPNAPGSAQPPPLPSAVAATAAGPTPGAPAQGPPADAGVPAFVSSGEPATPAGSAAAGDLSPKMAFFQAQARQVVPIVRAARAFSGGSPEARSASPPPPPPVAAMMDPARHPDDHASPVSRDNWLPSSPIMCARAHHHLSLSLRPVESH